MSIAFNDPKELQKVDPARHEAERIVAEIQYGDVPSMLRIPKKQPKSEDNGN